MRTKPILTILLACVFLINTGYVSAAPSTGTTIPEHMQPGTIIKYDQNNQMIVVGQPSAASDNESLSKGQSNGTSSKSEQKIDKGYVQQRIEEIRKEAETLPHYYLGEPQLPKSQPGMEVIYDGIGDVFKVTLNGKNITPTSPILRVELPTTGASDTKTYSNETIMQPMAQTLERVGTWYYGSYDPGPNHQNELIIRSSDREVVGDGQVTWYSGQPGDSGQTLQDNDCATKLNYDQPPDGTPVMCEDYYNDAYDTVYKNDVGGLPNAILDIRQNEMENAFYVPTGPGYGSFYGLMYHSY